VQQQQEASRRSALTGQAGPSLNRPDYSFILIRVRFGDRFFGFRLVWVLSNKEISTQHLIQTSDAQRCFDLRAAWSASGPLLLRLSTLEFLASVYESTDHLIGSGNKSVRSDNQFAYRPQSYCTN